MNTCTLGYDLGGTKLASALVDSNGKILSYFKSSVLEIKSLTKASQSQNQLIQMMWEHFLFHENKSPHLFKSKKFLGIGLASAGPLNVETGELIYPANFPNWKKFKIIESFKKKLHKEKKKFPVYFQNDAVASALAEGWVGGAQGLSSYVVITVGTGIGTGVIFRNQPVQFSGMGSEFGHLIVNQTNPTSFYQRTVEGISSGTALVQRANKEFHFHCQQVEEIVEALPLKPELQLLFDDAALALASLCYNLSIGFHLEKIFFSGGMSQISYLFLDKVKKNYDEQVRSFNASFKAPLLLAKTGNRSGAIGAARLPYLS